MSKYSTGKLVLLAAAALAFELTLAEAWSIGGARAEALLSLACFAALFARDSGQGLTASWIIGLLKDVGSAGPLGLHALLFLGAGWVVLQIRQILFRESPLTQLGVAFVAACWVNLAAAIVVSISVGGIPFGVIVGKTLLSALFTAVLTVPLHLTLMHVRFLVR
ncbi:MAG TPA: rod shape-determining protein MreD [Planctomycetota bacterium]|jgi:rod shape-determining protein MreD|nr:rod shape-determining protein MreD [Planctomycetota bacterium]